MGLRVLSQGQGPLTA